MAKNQKNSEDRAGWFQRDLRGQYKNDIKIVTVTLNPVLDRTLWVKDFKAGKTFLANESKTFAGGKGVNVSRALLNFGIHSTATGIIGKDGKDTYLKILHSENIPHDFITTDGPLRTNITIAADKNLKETHIREKGPHLQRSVLTTFEDKLRRLLAGESTHSGSCRKDFGRHDTAGSMENRGYRPIVVFSGSVPSGIPCTVYRDLIDIAKKLNAAAYLDASGNTLREGLNAKPLMIKPNVHEVHEILGFFPESKDNFIKAFDTFHALEIAQVMISRGSKGLMFSRGEGIVSAHMTVTHPTNTVGSGDAALAGGVLGTINNLDTEQTARLACAMGSANTLRAGACIFNREDVLNFYERVKIEYL